MENKNIQIVPKRILSSLIASVSAGVVPRAGAPYMAIGRNDEITALLEDLERISFGEGRMRFIIGRYGSGKSFLIQLVRGYALEKGFITADADLSPERRLYGTNGSGIATYRELVKNMASKSSPDGGALSKIISKWITEIRNNLLEKGISDDSPTFALELHKAVSASLRDIEFLVGGFDFSKVVTEYYVAYVNGNDEKQSACIRWLRGEYSTKTEAKHALGFNVSTIVDDDNWYDYIKLWAVLVRKMGYRGLVVFIDECVNLYKIPNRISRENNYEKILSMFNDALQGHAEGLAIIFGGTPQFLDDTRRGLFSYEALRSRLVDSKYELAGFKNLNNPIIRLVRLSDNELFALLKRMTDLFYQYYSCDLGIKDENIADFLRINLQRAGTDSMITPREMLRDYMSVLNILLQNPQVDFNSLVASQSCESSQAETKPQIKTISAEDISF